jgi:hypothetical protein
MSDELLGQVKWQVDQVLEELGSYFTRIESGRYRAVQGSAEIWVEVERESDGEVLVRIRAPVAYHAAPDTLDLTFLLQANGTMPVATFGMDDDRTISVGQTLYGEHLHPEHLRKTVRAVAIFANCLDELIAQRTDGRRSIDVKPWLK